MRLRHFTAALLLPLALTACGGGEETAAGDGGPKKEIVDSRVAGSFSEPDIRNDFCGVHISFRFCKCAFHDEYCDAIGMEQDAADSHVQSQFNAHVQDLRDDFLSTCGAQGGFVDSRDRCQVCDAPAVLENRQCVIYEEEPEEETAEDTEDGQIACSELEENWRKYSDIDDRIDVPERSYEAKMFAETQEKIIENMVEGFELEYDTALMREQLTGIEEYRTALVDNLRDNLVKATIRLAYVTYTQIEAGKGAGKSFSTFLTSTESVEALGAGLKAAQAVVPKGSQLEIDTKTVGGKMKSIGWNATLEAIESMGDPSAIAQQVMKDTKNAVVPSADISDEEIAILRQQHIQNELLKQMEAEARAAIAANEARMAELEHEIAALQQEADRWEAEEKARVLLLLEDECS